jgi:hypothetical protein
LRQEFGERVDQMIEACTVQSRQALLAVFDAHDGPGICSEKAPDHLFPSDAEFARMRNHACQGNLGQWTTGPTAIPAFPATYNL